MHDAQVLSFWGGEETLAAVEDMLTRLVEGAQHHQLFAEKNTPALLMVSGGSDSVAMARMVCACRQQLGIGEMRLLHINHCLRGDASDGDEAFVVALAQELGIACRVHRVDVATYVAESGANMEQLARHIRYERAFEELNILCQETGRSAEEGRILVAHTQDDRAETFFMRAIVGAGLGGLSSLKHRNGQVVRPLLDFSRSELREWLCQHIPAEPRWREDASNEETKHFRNFVRHRVIPVAQEYNPSLNTTVCRSMDVLAEDDDLISQLADKFYDQVVVEEEGLTKIDCHALAMQHVALQRRVLRKAVQHMLPQTVRLGAEHVEQLVESGACPGFSLLLPHGLLACNEYGTLVLRYPHDRNEALDALRIGAWLPVPGSLALQDGRRLYAQLVSKEDANALDFSKLSSSEAYVDASQLDKLWVYAPIAGMRMQPLGMQGASKKVAHILKDAKVPVRLRSTTPVVCAGSEEESPVVWLCGHGIDHRFRITSATTCVVHLRLE